MSLGNLCKDCGHFENYHDQGHEDPLAMTWPCLVEGCDCEDFA